MDLSRETIKYMAAGAMLLDHIAVRFLAEGSQAYSLFRMAGGMTAITMCFFLAEGYRKTSDLKRYKQRLLLFAVLAQIPYMLLFHTGAADFAAAPLNMLFNLFFSLWFLELARKRCSWKYVLPVLCCLCDWSFLAPAYVLLFSRQRDSRLPWILAIGLNVLLSGLTAVSAPGHPLFSAFLSVPGQVAAMLLILFCYRGRKLQRYGKFHKWFFYFWYILHLLCLQVYAILIKL